MMENFYSPFQETRNEFEYTFLRKFSKEFREKFFFVKHIDEGSYGKVILATDKNGKYHAIKIQEDLDCEYITFLREAETMIQLGRHPNIVELRNIGINANTFGWLQLEYVPYNLSWIIEQSSFEQRLDLIPHFCFQILSCLDYIHEKGYIHGDIKPQNILVNPQEKTNKLLGRNINYKKLDYKLCDFGLAVKYTLGQQNSGNLIFTTPYRAPEAFVDSQENITYTPKSDIWAIGIILLDILFATNLFLSSHSTPKIKENIFKFFHINETPDVNSISVFKYLKEACCLKNLPNIDEELLQFISQFLDPNYSTRFDEKQLLSHPYMKKFYPNDLKNVDSIRTSANFLHFPFEVETIKKYRLHASGKENYIYALHWSAEIAEYIGLSDVSYKLCLQLIDILYCIESRFYKSCLLNWSVLIICACVGISHAYYDDLLYHQVLHFYVADKYNISEKQLVDKMIQIIEMTGFNIIQFCKPDEKSNFVSELKRIDYMKIVNQFLIQNKVL